MVDEPTKQAFCVLVGQAGGGKELRSRPIHLALLYVWGDIVWREAWRTMHVQLIIKSTHL